MKVIEHARLSRWFVRGAVALFLVSLVLPAARLGAPGGRTAIGLVAAMMAAYVLPAALLMLAIGSSGGLGDSLYAVLTGIYLLVLLAQNLLMVLALVPRLRHRLTRRHVVIAALLPWGVLLLDLQRLYPALGLTRPETAGLRAGYFLWGLSFVVLAAGVWWGNGSGGADRRTRVDG